jgi:hypothetical protein
VNLQKIKTSKYKNLLDLLQFIPPIHRTFYQELSHTGNQRNVTKEAENSDNGEDSNNLFECDYEQVVFQWDVSKTLLQ